MAVTCQLSVKVSSFRVSDKLLNSAAGHEILTEKGKDVNDLKANEGIGTIESLEKKKS